MRLLICGSREFPPYANSPEEDLCLSEYCDKHIMKMLNNRLSSGDTIEVVEGGARGADKFGKDFALKHNFLLTEIKAEWDKYGKRAGFERNKEMFEYIRKVDCNAVIVLWDGSSKGTLHDIALAVYYNIQLRIFDYTKMRWLSQEEAKLIAKSCKYVS